MALVLALCDCGCSGKTRRMRHNKEVAIYAVLMFVAMLSLTLMAPVIQEFIIDRFKASNTEASMFFF